MTTDTGRNRVSKPSRPASCYRLPITNYQLCKTSKGIMTTSVNPVVLPPAFPNHTQLPDSDGTFVKNFQEHPQSLILTDSIGQILQQRHPDGQYAICQDCGIYWRETEPAKVQKLLIGFTFRMYLLTLTVKFGVPTCCGPNT